MDRIKSLVVPTLSIIVFLLVWEYSTVLFKVPAYLLPGPKAVAESIWSLYSTGAIFPHIWMTFKEIVIGYAAGCSVAFALGSLVAEFALLERIFIPFVVGFQSMPKVALAPLLLVWFGFDLASKVILVGLICFFPMFINTIAGLRAANPDLIDLYRACSSPRWLIFLDVKLPGAANSMFAGLQIAIVMALLGAVVGEFVAARSGLGYLIQSSAVNFDVSAMFASVFTLSAMGIIATQVVRVIHRKVVYWENETATYSGSSDAAH